MKYGTRRGAGSILAACGLLASVSAISGCSSDALSPPGSEVGGAAAGGAATGGGAPTVPAAGAAPVTGMGGANAGASPGGASAGDTNASAGNGGALGTAGAGGMGELGGSGGTSSPPSDVGTVGDGDLTIGPTYTKDKLLTDQGKTKGKRFAFTMHSQDSSIFKGDDKTLSKPAKKTNWDRVITIYVPDQYKDGTEAPLLVLLEGAGGPNSPVNTLDSVSRALDNMTIATDPSKKLPPFVVVAVANGSDRDGTDGKGSERGLEFDTMSDRFTRFVETEVLPAVLADTTLHAAYPNLKLTRNPDGRGVMGCSSGGAAALTMGWFSPDKYRRIITYSGTFVNQQNPTQPEEVMYPFGAWNYHSEKELIKNADAKPLRIFIAASERDAGYTNDPAGHNNWLIANQRTGAALKAKAYHYRFTYGLNVGHCDGKVFDLTLADTLAWMWRGYPTP